MSVSVRDFGAVGDGSTDDTIAFESALTFLQTKHGGGTLVVEGPAFTYLVRPLTLISNLIFQLEPGATVLGVADEAQWPLVPGLPSYGQGRDHPGPRYSSLLQGNGLVNLTIAGSTEAPESTVLDGNGNYWYDMRRAGEDRYTRGHLLELLYSKNVRVKDITMKDSPMWFNHIFDCDHVHFSNVHIQAPEHSPNTDGWDPDSSRNVLIEDSSYTGGDDCVAIKSGWDCFGVDYNTPSVNITMRNLTCGGSFAGGIALGSEMSGGLENILGENLYFPDYVNKPVNIKVGNKRGGYVRNVTFRDMYITGTLQQPAIHVDYLKYSNPKAWNPSCPIDWEAPALPVLADIRFERLNGSTATFEGDNTFFLWAFEESPLIGLYLEDVYFPPAPNGANWNCSGIHGTVKKGTVEPWPPCSGIFHEPSQLSHHSTVVAVTREDLSWRPRLDTIRTASMISLIFLTVTMIRRYVYRI